MELGAGVGEDLSPASTSSPSRFFISAIRMPLDGARWRAADRPHELLELARDAAIDGPLTRVVGRGAGSLTSTSRDRLMNISTARRPMTSRACWSSGAMVVSGRLGRSSARDGRSYTPI
jgi:hypothetical protein